MAEIRDLSLQITAGPDADAQELFDLAQDLRRELLELEVENVELARGAAPPPGAKAVDALEAGRLVVELAASSGLLASLVSVLTSWFSRPHRSVKLEFDGDTLELTNVSSADQKRLIDEWIARHATG